MAYLKNKTYPKIDWVKLYEADVVSDCIEDFDLETDNVLACYNGLVNDSMIEHIHRVLDNSGYDKNILILATCRFLSEVFNKNGLDSIFAHKDLIELQVQNFYIESLESDLDFITISRESKRQRIEEFLDKKWWSCTWDDNHYPDPTLFSKVNSGARSDCEISHMINACKYGYFATDDLWESNPPFKFWLCGKPSVMKVSDYNDGIGTFCTDFNHINLNYIKSVDDIDFDRQWDAERIRSYAYGSIQAVRYSVNEHIKNNSMSEHLLIESVENIDHLPKW